MSIDPRLISPSHADVRDRQGGNYHLTLAEREKIQGVLRHFGFRNTVGIELDGTTWRNINVWGQPIDNSIVKRNPCLLGIHSVTVDGQAMVEIPKFYFKFEEVDGKQRWLISPEPLNGFSVHKGFVYNGVEKTAFQIGAYPAGSEILEVDTGWVNEENEPITQEITLLTSLEGAVVNTNH